jgi:hypothetical protein
MKGARMTNPDVTLVAALLDRSGSMETSKLATEDGWRELINGQRQLPGECQVMLAQFDTVYEVVYPPTPVADVPEFEVQPRGMTALLDATGRFITEVGQRLSALPEHRRPGQVICLIMTDGMENSSHEWSWDSIKKLIEQQQKQWQWNFIFIGANMDAVEVGARMGLQAGDAITYNDADYEATSAVSRLAHERISAVRAGAMPAPFSDADRKAAMG